MEYNYILLFLIFFIVAFLIILAASLCIPGMSFFLLSGIKIYYKKIRYESQYFRDILSYTPSEIYYINNKGFTKKLNGQYYLTSKLKKLFLINLLKMNLLGYITIDFSNKDNFKIIKKDIIILDEEYKIIYDYIFSSVTYNSEIRLYDIYDYIDIHYNDDFFEKWDNLIKKGLIRKGFKPGNLITFYGDKMKTYYTVVIFIIVIFCLFAPTRAKVIVLCTSPLFLIAGYFESKNIKVYSKYAIYEYKKIKAMKKFLKDFSIVRERGTEYSKVLEDYIVYASIFDMIETKNNNLYRPKL